MKQTTENRMYVNQN